MAPRRGVCREAHQSQGASGKSRASLPALRDRRRSATSWATTAGRGRTAHRLADGREVVTQKTVFERVWGRATLDDAQMLRARVSHLRKKIGQVPDSQCYIVTEPGVGFRFCCSSDKGV